MSNWKDKFLEDIDAVGDKKDLKDYRAFVFWYIKAVEDLSDDAVLQSITDGGHDAGIDAIIIDENLKIIKIVQSKFSREIGEKSFQKDELNKLNKISDYMTGKAEYYELRDYVHNNLKDLLDKVVRLIKEEGYRLKLLFITTNKANPNSILYNDGDVPIEIVAEREIEGKYEAWMHGHTPELGEITLDFVSILEGPSDPRAFLITLPSETIKREYLKYKNKLFSRNVRVFYGDSPKANKNMKKTLIENPRNFWYFNNGVTILSESVRINEVDKKVHLKNPQIINGCQTVSTIGESRQAQALLFAKIIEIADNVSNQLLIDGIIESNNRQTPVDERMLKSNHPLQIKLQRELKEKGFFYERKEGEYENLKRDPKIERLQRIKNLDLLKANLAIVKPPHICQAKEDDLFSTHFGEVFQEDRSHMDYLVPYLIWKEIIKVARHINGDFRRRFHKLASFHILRMIYDNSDDIKNPSRIYSIYTKLSEENREFKIDRMIIKELCDICYDRFKKSNFAEKDSGQRDFFKSTQTYNILLEKIPNSLKSKLCKLFK